MFNVLNIYRIISKIFKILDIDPIVSQILNIIDEVALTCSNL